MPTKDSLPESLAELSDRQAVPIGGYPQRNQQISQLCKDLERILEERQRSHEHIHEHIEEPLPDLLSRMDEVENGLVKILQPSMHQIRAIQITAKNFFSRRIHSTGPHPLREELRYSRKRDLFHLDDGDEVDGFDVTTIGNMSGKGNLEEREEAFWTEIDMALELTTLFQIIRTVLPNIVWVYYTSAQGFIYIMPWTPHSRVNNSYSPTLLTLEFFTMGRFEENPERGLFWTKPYCDEYGKGMMVTLGAPIDNDGNFLGTVAIDLSVDLFNEHLRHHDLRGGELVLVNEHLQVLGHPSRTSSDDKEVQSLAEVTGVDAFDGIELGGWEPRTVRTVAGRKAFFVAVENSPWRLFFVSAP
jgi:hypothetical protein